MSGMQAKKGTAAPDLGSCASNATLHKRQQKLAAATGMQVKKSIGVHGPGSTASNATLNKFLQHLAAAAAVSDEHSSAALAAVPATPPSTKDCRIYRAVGVSNLSIELFIKDSPNALAAVPTTPAST
jgi:hypothetical protein